MAVPNRRSGTRGSGAGARAGGHGSDRTTDRSGKPRSGARRDDAARTPRSADQARYDGPPIPDDITGRELDRSVRQQLRTLPEKLAARVARHLVAAGRLIEIDPETAYQHTLAARSRAARLAVVREASAEAAYAAGHYQEALTEFRAVKRMSGNPAFLPVIADCERALGRPERALKIAQDPAISELSPADRVEMLIVAAGARLDMGQPEAAALMLESQAVGSRARSTPAARLRYAYAEALLAAGRSSDALEWFHRAAASDAEGVMDAAERAAALEGIELVDTVEPADDDSERVDGTDD
jgi:tetratricopeptide (TPR) repeat protein